MFSMSKFSGSVSGVCAKDCRVHEGPYGFQVCRHKKEPNGFSCVLCSSEYV